jgi:hypothetical protein
VCKLLEAAAQERMRVVVEQLRAVSKLRVDGKKENVEAVRGRTAAVRQGVRLVQVRFCRHRGVCEPSFGGNINGLCVEVMGKYCLHVTLQRCL